MQCRQVSPAKVLFAQSNFSTLCLLTCEKLCWLAVCVQLHVTGFMQNQNTNFYVTSTGEFVISNTNRGPRTSRRIACTSMSCIPQSQLTKPNHYVITALQMHWLVIFAFPVTGKWKQHSPQLKNCEGRPLTGTSLPSTFLYVGDGVVLKGLGEPANDGLSGPKPSPWPWPLVCELDLGGAEEEMT